ncbi:MAG: succinylglutamate desuccinylase/aspartoacylase family protein [Qingshengfaniella sp.]
MIKRTPFKIGGRTIAPGSRETVDLPVSVLSDHTAVAMSVHVVHGRRPGPTMFVSAGIHGDEVIGVEIVRRLLRAPKLRSLRGTLLVVPIVNSFGFINRSRYLPDRRDLNRSFPGSPGGSLAARLAHHFFTEVVARCDYGIDLHSAAIHRTNLPQVRVSPGSAQGMELARVFGPPVILTSGLRDGSLRQAAGARGVEVLLYEAGEGLRFDEMAVRAGFSGILRVLRHLDMLPARGIALARATPVLCGKSSWVRAPAGGILRMFCREGEVVAEGALLGVVSDPFGEDHGRIVAPGPGVIVGRAVLPIVNEGDAIFHLAAVSDHSAVEAAVDDMAAQLSADPLFDEDEII